MPDDLSEMTRGLRALGLEAHFGRVHHFSDEAFASRPATLAEFERYCDGVGHLEPGGENPQTIRRALCLIEGVRGGQPVEAAVAKAWRRFPLVTR